MAKPNSKDKLVEAMASLILEKGLADTSPSDILTRSGVGHGSLYHHFKGKDDLAQYAVNYNIDKWINLLSPVFSGNQSPKEKLSAYCDNPRDIKRGCLVGQMARDGEAMSVPEIADAVTRGFSWIRDTLEQLLREGIQSGDFKANLDPSDTAVLILSSIQGSYVVAKGLQSKDYFARTTESLKKMILND